MKEYLKALKKKGKEQKVEFLIKKHLILILQQKLIIVIILDIHYH